MPYQQYIIYWLKNIFILFDRQEKYNIEKKYEETYSMLKIKENQILVLQTEVRN